MATATSLCSSAAFAPNPPPSNSDLVRLERKVDLVLQKLDAIERKLERIDCNVEQTDNTLHVEKVTTAEEFNIQEQNLAKDDAYKLLVSNY